MVQKDGPQIRLPGIRSRDLSGLIVLQNGHVFTTCCWKHGQPGKNVPVSRPLLELDIGEGFSQHYLVFSASVFQHRWRHARTDAAKNLAPIL